VKTPLFSPIHLGTLSRAFHQASISLIPGKRMTPESPVLPAAEGLVLAGTSEVERDYP
jgi:hypothetical protein